METAGDSCTKVKLQVWKRLKVVKEVEEDEKQYTNF
jgi:hypothetical protein